LLKQGKIYTTNCKLDEIIRQTYRYSKPKPSQRCGGSDFPWSNKIQLDAKEISQLVLNLCRNGLEAMHERGTLTIRTYIEGEHLVLSVQDEGCGISIEYLDKLGTPFFTTKENGTGLGLATCYSIANQHNARIDVDSDVVLYETPMST